MIELSNAFYQGGIVRFLPGIGGTKLPGLTPVEPGPGSGQDLPEEIQLTDYQKAVIRYYETWGYIPNQVDRNWYRDFIANYTVNTTPESIQVVRRPDDGEYAHKYQEPEELGYDRYHWQYGTYSDETLPMANPDDWWR